ncbi:MAG: bifunctional DNA-formamidopyrimidine glycosylase/DNA-(apurinic or apyrimidinic site) lyase [Gemmatimonadota bacterium]
MPELPEAETIVRGLRPHVVGRTVTRVDVLHADVLRTRVDLFVRAVSGRSILAVERRGKNVVMPLSEGRVLAVNLGMTGKLLSFPVTPPAERTPTHPAVRFDLGEAGILVFDDTRRFGTVECLDEGQWRVRSDRMGPEPLGPGFTARRLHQGLGRSRAPIRSWLLDQRRIAGVGNIYANEALYQAGIDPRRPARDVDPDEAARLHRALRRVLRNAIQEGGTTLRDYRTASGERGRYARSLDVYGRAGDPCARCGTVIERVVFGNRSAFLCPGCQPGDGRSDGAASSG